jgi:hypothetical protein
MDLLPRRRAAPLGSATFGRVGFVGRLDEGTIGRSHFSPAHHQQRDQFRGQRLIVDHCWISSLILCLHRSSKSCIEAEIVNILRGRGV